MERVICKNCGHPIEEINYALGAEWMHIEPHAAFPTTYKGTAWKFCKIQVAEPGVLNDLVVRP